jgi:hypothetical protein
MTPESHLMSLIGVIFKSVGNIVTCENKEVYHNSGTILIIQNSCTSYISILRMLMLNASNLVKN